MKLHELEDSSVKEVEKVDPCVGIMNLGGGVRLKFPHTQRDTQRAELGSMLPDKIYRTKQIIMVNEEGLAEYVRVYPDGHLGAVED